MQALRQTKTEVPLRINTVLLNKQIRNTKDTHSQKDIKRFYFYTSIGKETNFNAEKAKPTGKSKLEEMGLQILVPIFVKKKKKISSYCQVLNKT